MTGPTTAERPDRALIQASYLIVTGLWPLASYRSFEWVTGTKRDDWLVKTIGLLTAIMGVAIMTDGGARTRQTRLLGVGSAVAFGLVDVWYAGVRRRIRPIYLADAVVQTGFLVGWLRRPDGRLDVSSVPPTDGG